MLKAYFVKLYNHEAQETFRAVVSVKADGHAEQNAEIAARCAAPAYRSSWKLEYVQYLCDTPQNFVQEV